MDRGSAAWTTWFIVIGTAAAILNEATSSVSAVSATTIKYATTVQSTSDILSMENDHTTAMVKENSRSKETESIANETPGIETAGTVQSAAGDDQHNGSSPHTATIQSTILSTSPSDGHSTTVVLSGAGTVEVNSAVTSGVQSSAEDSTVGGNVGHSTVGSSADTQPGIKPGSDSSKGQITVVGTTATVEQTTNGFKSDDSNVKAISNVSNVTESERISGNSTPLLSSTVNPVRDSTATLSISLTTPMQDSGKTCIQLGLLKDPLPGPDELLPVICNCSVHDSKVSCNVYWNDSDHLCSLASENIACREDRTICNVTLTKHPHREILCEIWNHTGSERLNHSVSESWNHTVTEPWNHTVSESWNYTVTESWNHSVSESWNHTVTEPWNHSVSESWNHTVTEPWNHTVSESWNHTVTEPWNHSVSESWNHTVTEPWNHTVSESWNHTVTEPWNHTVSEPWYHTGSFDNDQFSSSGISTQSAISGAMAVETTTSVSTEGVSLSGYSVVLSTVTDKPEHRAPDKVNVVDDENFILLSWNQSGNFDNVLIYLNESKYDFNDFNNCSQSAFNKITFVNCSLKLNKTFSPGELLNVTVIVGDSSSLSTTYVKQPATPKHLEASVANKTVCFKWTQEGFYDRFQVKLFLPTNITYSEVYDNITGNKTAGGDQIEMCIDSTDSLCPATELRLELRADSHNRTSKISNTSFYSAPSAPVVNCSQPTNSSFYVDVTQNHSNYCLAVNNLSQSDFTHGYSVKSNFTDAYNISFSRGSSLTNVNVSKAGVNYQIEAWTAANGVLSRSSSVSCTTFPNPPSGVEIWGVTPTSASFNWSRPLGEADEFVYHCQRISNGQPMKIHKTRQGSAMNGTCANLNASENYKVSVRSIVRLEQDGNISSADSTEMEFWTLPERVSFMNLSSLNHSSLKVIWNQEIRVHGVTGYDIELRNSSGIVLQKLTNISGHANECGDKRCYVFIDLMSRTNYTVSLCAVNPAGGTGDAVEASMVTSEQVFPPGGDMSLLKTAISVTVVLLLLVVILVSFLLFCRKQTKFAVPSSKRPSDLLGFPNPSFNLALEPVEVREKMKPDPVPYDDFLSRVEELHKDSDFSFSGEYSLLQELSPKHPQKAAEMEDNRIKNRYSNILPFDHSRVKLIPLDDDDQCSDYINANYMPGFSTKREFIAAQGPMKSTVDEFWRMIWEQNTTTIVMVTNLQERGREKCAEYWPMEGEPIFYGDIQVQLSSESQLNYYIIRLLEVKWGEKRRTVKHLHFIAWPDFGCPENTSVLLDFVTGVRSHMSSPASQNTGSGPILVHCSAGVGRTGTFILVDRLLQHLRSRNPIDVFGIVLEMRNYRCNMIQTESQYVFAYECIKTAIERQMVSNHIDETDENADESLYQNFTSRGVGVPPEEESLYQNFNPANQTAVEMESADI